jgi:hypothetical protein
MEAAYYVISGNGSVVDPVGGSSLRAVGALP